MYKLLLCWRYLKTRFLAMICIVSVMLGVATLVVVNSVMSGFSTKLKDRLHGLLSDVVIEANNYNGLPLSDEEMLRRIRESPAGPHIEAMTPTIEVVAMLNFNARLQGGQDDGFLTHTPTQPVTRPLHLMGVDPKGRSAIKGFAEYLYSKERQQNPSFDLTQEAKDRFERNYPLRRDPMWQAGAANAPALIPVQIPDLPGQKPDDGPPPPDPVPSEERDPKGIIIGHAIASYQDGSTPPKDIYVLLPGDKVSILTVGVGKDHIEPVYGDLVVCDYIKTEMAEYDGNYVFVPLEYLQQLRGTPGRSTQIQIKLKDYAQAAFVVQELSKLFSPYPYNCSVETWEAKQGPLLAAIAIESRILNVLLFMITGVAGFGILAIFSMIVVEKTRDIGILKSLGAFQLWCDVDLPDLWAATWPGWRDVRNDCRAIDHREYQCDRTLAQPGDRSGDISPKDLLLRANSD